MEKFATLFMIHEIFVVIGVFVISFFSVMSGGAGLLTRPFLILLGYPPAIAIGSFRVANLVTRLTSLSLFLGKRPPIGVDWRLAAQLFFPSLIGGIIGAEIVAYLNEELLKRLLGLFIILMNIILIFRDRVGVFDAPEKLTKTKKYMGYAAAAVIGIIASFLGGSGILFAYLMIFVYHKSYLSSVPVRKIANFGSAFSSAILFMIQGIVSWPLVLSVMIAGSVGEYLGARYQIKKGESLIKHISFAIVLIAGFVLLLT